MSWINRSIVRTGSFAAALVALLSALAIALPAAADAPLTVNYQGRTIRLTHVVSRPGGTAIGVEDPGFAALLRATGAVLTWKPGERYILISTSAPEVVSFAIDDRRYDVGPIALEAGFAPFLSGDEAYLPLRELLRGLDLALRQDGSVSILQPQLASLDVRQQGARTVLFAHAGAALHARVAQEGPGTVTYAFDGVGTTLSGSRQIGAGGVRSIQIANSGTIREPVTLVTVTLDQGAVAEPPQNTGGSDVALTFDAPPNAGSNGSQTVGASPAPEQAPGAEASSGPAQVTGVTIAQSDDGSTVTISVTGNAAYEWHRLREPDNRFWIDIANAQLQGAPIDQNEQSPLLSMRVRQDDPTTVRIALSLSGPKPIAITQSATGLEITVGTQDVADAARFGNGSIGSSVAAEQAGSAVTPAPGDQTGGGIGYDDSGWKFGPRSGYVPTNPRLIVIDPGHGGSDVGTVHGGISEATLTLDMAKRLRVILMGRGWDVKMTRETDVDVYEPNDSAHDELQARDDIANNAGARLLVSIHANAYINSGPYGTTCYISKPEDVPLARAVERRLAADGTKDDGVIKSHLYVTLHARMPAVLIETAFLSNPSDYALLASSAWRQKVAQEIADGIGEYAQEYPVANQPSQ